MLRFHHLIIFVSIFAISIISTNNAYASHILDGASYYADHPFRLTIVNPLNTANGVQVVVDSPASGTCTYTLTKIVGTNTWQSSYIYFTTGSTCNSTTLPMGTLITGSISASTDDASPSPETASVIASDDSGWPPQAMSPQPQWAKKNISCTSYGNDPDEDGICSNWECGSSESGCTPGLTIPYLDTGHPTGSWTFPCNVSITNDCPDDNVKDVYVEVDWMRGHRPTDAAIQDVKNAFAASGYGILHVLVDDDDILHKDTITAPVAGGAGSTEVDTIKKAFFGTDAERNAGNEGIGSYNHKLTSKKLAFHYALFIHKQSADGTSSGIAELPGNDFVISLGNSAFAGSVGSVDQQEGTFMHELGHNLYLDHGGSDATNCKPNYLSVMSYSRQFKEFYPTVDRDLDYSRQAIGPKPTGNPDSSTVLAELTLVESGQNGGIDSYPTLEKIVYGISSGGAVMFANTGGDVNWNGDGTTGGTVSAVVHRINERGCTNTSQTTLSGIKDWNNPPMDFTTQGSSSWSDGARVKIVISSGASATGSANENEKPVKVYDFKLPTFKKVINEFVKDYYTAWYNNYTKVKLPSKAWVDKVTYTLTNETTSNIVRGFRLGSMDYLNYVVDNLNTHSFTDYNQGISALHDSIDEVRENVNKDDMSGAVNELFNLRSLAIKYIDNYKQDQDKTISLIDNIITDYEIASTTYEHIPYLTSHPSNATITLDYTEYGLHDKAIVTVTDKNSNLDDNKAENILARMSSTANPVGIIIELRETGDDTGIFVSNDIILDTGYSDSTRLSPVVRVHDKDHIWATYNGAIDEAIINAASIHLAVLRPNLVVIP